MLGAPSRGDPMCGIAGIYRRGERPPTDAERAADQALVSTMLRAIEYRGPDDRGLDTVGRATLGVRRLAILDVAGGHQPIADAEQRVWAIQNGEIYNYPALRADLGSRHALRTTTDTELFPYLYLERGVEFVRELRGMFAVAVYDVERERLLLARDPLGVKPLYVATVGDRVLFASEIKCLLCDPDLPRDLDLDAFGRFLALGWIPGEATPFRAIRRVRPGCRVVLEPGTRKDERYWAWPRFFPRNGTPEPPIDVLADQVGSRIAESVVSMLLSDRPLGILLSGGIDSSLLVALLPEAVRRETRTFSIGFEGAGYHDERPYARAVAERFGTRHREFTVPIDVARELPRITEFLDEPLADAAAVPAHLVARAASSEVTVLLSGTGGDEVFGGYRRYRMGSLLRRARIIPRALAGAGARALTERDQHRRTRAGERMVMVRKLLEARSRPRFIDAYLSAFEPAPPGRWAEALAVATDPAGVGRALMREIALEAGATPRSEEELAFTVDHLYYLPDDLLLKEDRTTMGASVEGRVPYLDHPLVEFAAGLSLASRLDGGNGKQLLRVLARRHLPPEISERPKHGFSVPIEDWLRGPLDTLVGDVFAGSGSGMFRMDVLRRWHEEHRARRDRSGPLWAALSFELWWSLVGSASPERIADGGRPLALRAVPS
jgi:asparagine synthase (glutamine-hydrolysing)